MDKKKCFYECYRCEKIFSQKGNIKIHLNRKKPCGWKNEDLKTTDEDVYNKSIEKKYEETKNETEPKNIISVSSTTGIINESTIINYNIDIKKEQVEKYLIKSFAPFFDGIDIVDENRKGFIFMYHFNDELLHSLKVSESRFDEIARDIARPYHFDQVLPINKEVLFRKVVEKVKDLIYEILMDIRKRKIHNRLCMMAFMEAVVEHEDDIIEFLQKEVEKEEAQKQEEVQKEEPLTKDKTE